MSSRKRSYCVIPGCTETLRNEVGNISVHKFPSQICRREQRTKWVEVMRQLKGDARWEPSGHSCICSRHFDPSSFYSAGHGQKVHANALPTLLLSPEVVQVAPPNIPQAPEEAAADIKTDPDVPTDDSAAAADIKIETAITFEESTEITKSKDVRNFEICCPKCEEKIVLELCESESPPLKVVPTEKTVLS